MAKHDYYEVLGIKREQLNADEDSNHQILREAFRPLAMKYHPDKNQGDKTAEEKFKELNEAYEVLDNPEKRSHYDQLGHAAFDSRVRAAHSSPSGGVGGVMTDPGEWWASGGRRKNPVLDKELYDAVEKGNVNAAREIITKMKAADVLNVEVTDFLGISLIHMAAENKNDNVEMLDLLLKNGANPYKFMGVNGSLPVHLAAFNANPKCVDLLLKYTDANVLPEDGRNYTPLYSLISGMRQDGRRPGYNSNYMEMSEEKRKEMDERRIATAEILLNNGANPNLRSKGEIPDILKDEDTPLKHIRKWSVKADDEEESHWHIDEMACVPEIIRLFENWKGPSQKLSLSPRPALGHATAREEAKTVAPSSQRR